MPEEEKPITWAEVNYTCDDCAIGVMCRVPDELFQFKPTEYPHRCSYCGRLRLFYCQYPVIRYSGGDTKDTALRSIASVVREAME